LHAFSYAWHGHKELKDLSPEHQVLYYSLRLEHLNAHPERDADGFDPFAKEKKELALTLEALCVSRMEVAFAPDIKAGRHPTAEGFTMVQPEQAPAEQSPAAPAAAPKQSGANFALTFRNFLKGKWAAPNAASVQTDHTT
jgi:hypothetical protein